ncbi:hypothetical protein VNO77_03123 [Canavalia gladiata]|uniref:Uncharacterized protein n=1 Tax=Canavalia gladiata TaxID=3824 RepID=A0AAN9MW74_CANGL
MTMEPGNCMKLHSPYDEGSQPEPDNHITCGFPFRDISNGMLNVILIGTLILSTRKHKSLRPAKHVFKSCPNLCEEIQSTPCTISAGKEYMKTLLSQIIVKRITQPIPFNLDDDDCAHPAHNQCHAGYSDVDDQAHDTLGDDDDSPNSEINQSHQGYRDIDDQPYAIDVDDDDMSSCAQIQPPTGDINPH